MVHPTNGFHSFNYNVLVSKLGIGFKQKGLSSTFFVWQKGTGQCPVVHQIAFVVIIKSCSLGFALLPPALNLFEETLN